MPGPAVSIEDIALGSIDLSGSTPVLWYPAVPYRVLGMSVIITNDVTGGNAVVSGDVGKADLSGPVDPSGTDALGTMTITPAIGTGTAVIKQDTGESVGTRVVYPGELVTIASDGGATVGNGEVVLTVERLGYAGPDVRSQVANHPGSVTNPEGGSNVVEVTS